MGSFSIPYGHESLEFNLPDNLSIQVVESAITPSAKNPLIVVEAALDSTVGGVRFSDFQGIQSAAIAISDKTRPVPHHHLLPPLLRRLRDLGLSSTDIHFFIATGLHSRMECAEYPSIIPEEILKEYQIYCHDADDPEGLVYLGNTSRGTPVWVNRRYAEFDLRIVVGNIEPHQIQGFSGGVKSAAIGLAGRDTINANHSMMRDPEARMGSYDANPARQDVEEIGRMINIHFAINAILNNEKHLVHVLAGEPSAVIKAGIPLCLSRSLVHVSVPFDLVIASAGGHPKDINLYQSQKALSHASPVVRDGGTIILVSACPEGSGSRTYEEWMENMHNHEQVIERFQLEGFRIGAHKAFQIARDASRLNVILISEMKSDFVHRLLLTPSNDIQQAINLELADQSNPERIGILPNAPSTIPVLQPSGRIND